MDTRRDEKVTGGNKEVTYIPTGLVDEKVQLEPKNIQKRGDTFFLYFVLITANIVIFTKGVCMAWPSPVIPQLKSNNTEINPLQDKITTGQISMLFGIPAFFRILGVLLLGNIPDIIGRKYTLFSISLLTVLSHLGMIVFGSHVYAYIIGRSLVKFGLGLLLSVSPIYLSEVCEDHNRAKHGCLMMFFMPLGSLYSYLVGSVTSVRWFTLLCVAPLMIQTVLLLIFVPESPIYTASKGDRETTMKILKKLRSNKSEEEILQDYADINTSLRSRKEGFGGGFKELFGTRSLRIGILVGLVTSLSTHVSGANIVMGYLAPIFNEAESNLSGNSVAILVGVMKLLFVFVVVATVGRLGKKPLMMISCMATAVSLAACAVYFYLNAVDAAVVRSIRWFPIVCILVYISCYSLGLGAIPLGLMGELYPSDMRSTAICFVRTIVGVYETVSATAFPLLTEYWGVHCFMGISSIGLFICFIFMYFYMPETRGKSFLEIQDLLAK